MPNKRISELPLLITPQLSTVIAAVENGQTQKLSVGSLLNSGLPISASSLTATSINVDGNITATSFNVLSSSVIYQTGSSIFGDSLDDTHTFVGLTVVTGSLIVSGADTITSVGKVVVTGSLLVSGSTTQIGNNTLTGTTTLSGSIIVSGNLTTSGNVNIASGSFYRAGNKLFNYGDFCDTRTQSASLNTATSMLFNTTNVGGAGVDITSGSRITFQHTGVYNIQFSAQLDRKAGSGTVTTSIWLAYTGSNVPNSMGDVLLTGNTGAASTIASWNWLTPVTAGDWVEIKWSTTDTDIVLFATGSRTNPVRPAVPSIITTVTQVA